MRILSIPTVLLAVATLATPTLAQRLAPAPHDKVHAQMRRLIDERGPSKAWVFFKDKGIRDAAELRRATDRVVEEMDPRALARRAARRQAEGLADVHDVPVRAEYIEATRATGVDVVIESSWLNAISVHASLEELERIAALPFVERIEPVRRGVLVDGRDTLLPPVQHGTNALALKGNPPSFYGISYAQLAQIGITGLHERGFTGTGIVIGIVDTGFVRTHEAFNQPGHKLRVLKEYDFVNGDFNTANEGSDDPSQHNHGTYILGTLGAYLPNELVGAAYNASFILCKTEDITNEYQQEEDFYVAGLQFAEANGADVITSSLGYIDWYTQADLDGLTATTTIAANIATGNGIYYATAAGNSGNDTDPGTSSLIAPSDAFDVITCGAVTPSGAIAYFSSDGPTADLRVKPEVLASGFYTETVCPWDDTDCTVSVAGTSLSTPLIAGALACIAQARPNWSVATLRANLFATGDYYLANGGTDPDFVLGYGIPDARRAAKVKKLSTSSTFPGPPKVR